MELKVWVEGIQRVVCGVCDRTTCQVTLVSHVNQTTTTDVFPNSLLYFLFFCLFLISFSYKQDVVYALAHATGKTGRFTLIERWRNNERLLAPHEHPLKVISPFSHHQRNLLLFCHLFSSQFHSSLPSIHPSPYYH